MVKTTAPINRYRYNVSGMHCAACSSRIERVVSQLEGVETVAVNLTTETMHCLVAEGGVDSQQISERVKQLGFMLTPTVASRKTVEIALVAGQCSPDSVGIQDHLCGVAGVSAAEVNLATGLAVVEYDSSQLTLRALRKAIERLGVSTTVNQKGLDDFSKRQQQSARKLQQMKTTLSLLLIAAGLLFWLAMGDMIGLPLPAGIASEQAPLAFGLSQLVLVLPIIYLGRRFYIDGLLALLRKAPNMDSLIAVGTGAAFLYSCWGLLAIASGRNVEERVMDLYFETTGILIALVFLGKYFENKSKAGASEAIAKLLKLTPDTALLIEPGTTRQIATDEIEVADLLLIRAGERLPVDGVVVSGTGTVDEAMLTGESLPVEKRAGSNGYGGTMLTDGVLRLQALQTGGNTLVAKIIQLVQQAQGSKAPIASLADTISYYFVPTVMVIALISGLSWYFGAGVGFSQSLRFFVAVLVIACPCAMGLAIPTSMMAGTGRGAQLGVLIKSSAALQAAEKIDTVVFDKTGTLTRGEPQVIDYISPYHGAKKQQQLILAASAEAPSSHPLAQALVRYAHAQKHTLLEPESFRSHAGGGIEAQVDSHHVLIGNQRLLAAQGVAIPAHLGQDQGYAQQGHTVLYLAVDQTFSGVMVLADVLKDDARACVQALQRARCQVIMLTGDNRQTAAAIAQQAGIDEVYAEVLPADKYQKIQLLQAAGRTVAMVGDGSNDAPALSQADVGIALGSGTDIAVEAGDIVLIGGNLHGVTTALALARAVMQNIRQNLFWAFAYNVVGIPIAAGVLVIFGGPGLNPMIAGAAMGASSVSVVANALRLRFFSP